MSFRLSICIPTYNRGNVFFSTLESVGKQILGLPVELVISDNASTDNTSEVVAKFRDMYPQLSVKYFIWPENAGADRNFLKVVELAEGEYCWFLGSDDWLAPSGIKAVLNYLQAYPEVTGLSLNRVDFDSEMKYLVPSRSVAGGKIKESAIFRDGAQATCALGEYWGYISGQVVRRDRWNDIIAKYDVSRFFNAYVHMFIIASFVKERGNWGYLAEPGVYWRSGNDSFLQEGGALKRVTIDIDGYSSIFSAVWGVNSRVYAHVMNTVASVHLKYAFLGARLNRLPNTYFQEAFEKSFKVFKKCPGFWISAVPVLLTPSWVSLGVRWMYRNTLKKVWVKRLSNKLKSSAIVDGEKTNATVLTIRQNAKEDNI